MAPYRFSTLLTGHSKDVRCLGVHSGATKLVSGSRDHSVKIWGREGDDWTEERTFVGHHKYVSTVAALAPTEEFPEGLIYTGAHDGWIRAYSPGSVNPLSEVEAHASTVATLFVAKSGTVLSGSWDLTAKVWVDKLKPTLTLTGHEGAVWAVAILPTAGLMLTGGADKQLRLWRAGKCLCLKKDAHEQAVRAIKVMDDNKFLSCSNDGTIKLWMVNAAEGNLEVVKTIPVHEGFLYSMDLLPTNPEEHTWVVAGENSGIKVFSGEDETQTLNVPAISIWAVVALANGDIAAGCSDGKIWIFSKDVKRQADPDLQAVYENELSKFQRPAQTELEGIKTSDLPGPNALLAPGRRDGQTMMVKDGAIISVHSWSDADQKWTKIGDVVGQPGQDTNGAAPGGGKVTFEGKEYDYVFDIDIDEGVVLKLPYNKSEDAWTVAQSFIHKHQLPQVYLDTIAAHITKNSGGGQTAAPVARGYDPFTGDGAYTTGGEGATPSQFQVGGHGGSGADPLTGGSAYSSSGGDTNAMPMEVEVSHFPQTKFLTFEQKPQVAPMTKKLKELNEKVTDADSKLKEGDIERLQNLCSNERESTVDDIVCLLRALRWPDSMTIPALDILRCAVINPKVNQFILSDNLINDFISLLFTNISQKAPDNCKMLALRTFANMFATEKGLPALLASRDSLITRLAHLLPTENKNVQVAIASLMLNFSLGCLRGAEEEGQVQCVTSIGMLFLDGLTESEAIYRVLVALGTLLSGNPQNVRLAQEVQAKERVQTWNQLAQTSNTVPKKIGECASALLRFM